MVDESTGLKKDGQVRKIVVDRVSCIGARSCAIAAAKTFMIDEENLAYVNPDGQFDDDDTIIRGAEACPVLAIHLYAENEKKIFPSE